MYTRYLLQNQVKPPNCEPWITAYLPTIRAPLMLLWMLEGLIDWLNSSAKGPYIYWLHSHIHIHIRLHNYIPLHVRLRWYEPLSWGISSYTNCISNGPKQWGSRCRYTYNSWCCISGGKWLRVAKHQSFFDDPVYIRRVFLLLSSLCIIQSAHTVLPYVL